MKHFGKSAIAMLLVLVFMVGLIPTSAFASEPEAAEAHTEHSWDDWVVTEEPSCTEVGSKTRSCTACGETETAAIPAAGHSWGDWDVTAEATCTEAGSKTRSCTACGETETAAIPAAGHSWGEWTDITEPDCVNEGSHTHTCSVCGETVTAAIPALGHSWGDWTDIVEPTCTEEGSHTHTCSACGETVTEAIPALGHTWGEWVETVKPTCTEEGEHEHSCTVCGEKATEKVPALGHTWGEWTETLKPTCTEEGEREHSCTVCGEKETEKVPAAGHVWTEDNGVDLVKCKVCGILKLIADGGSFDMEFDGEQWIIAGDPNADVEGPDTWSALFAGMSFTGNWADDLVAAAKTQLGYRESSANYAVSTHGQRNGYTRYGDWYGIPYGDWCAMFISFCMNYAGIPESAMPYAAGCAAWANALNESGMYTSPDGYAPRSGDLIFFYGQGGIDHVGIVNWFDAYSGVVHTIEGNLNDRVATRELSRYDGSIAGYGVMPENPALSGEIERVDRTIRATAGGRTVTVSGMLPVDAKLSVVAIPLAAAAEILSAQTGETVETEGMVFAYDVSILSGGEKYDLETYGDTVTVSISDISAPDLTITHVKIDVTDENGNLDAAALGEAKSAQIESETLDVTAKDGTVFFDLTSCSILAGNSAALSATRAGTPNYDPEFQAEFEAKLAQEKPLIPFSIVNQTSVGPDGKVKAGDLLTFELTVDFDAFPSWQGPNGDWINYINSYDNITLQLKLPAGILFDMESLPGDFSITSVSPNDSNVNAAHTYTILLNNGDPFYSAGTRYFTFKTVVGNNGTAQSINNYTFPEDMATFSVDYTLIGKNGQPATDEAGNPLVYHEAEVHSTGPVSTKSPDEWIVNKSIVEAETGYNSSTKQVTYTWLVEVGLKAEADTSILVQENFYGRPGRDQVTQMLLGDVMSTIFIDNDTQTPDEDVTNNKTQFVIKKYTDSGWGTAETLTNSAAQKLVIWKLNAAGEIDTGAVNSNLVLNSGLLVDSNGDRTNDTLSPRYTKYQVTATYPVDEDWVARYPELSPYKLKETNTATINTQFAKLPLQESSKVAEKSVDLPLEGAAHLKITKQFRDNDDNLVAYNDKYGRLPYWLSATNTFSVYDADNNFAKDADGNDMTGKTSYELESGKDYYLTPGIAYSLEERMTQKQQNAMIQTDDPAIKTNTPAPGAQWPVTFHNKERLGKLVITKRDDGHRIMSNDPIQTVVFQLYDSENNLVVVGYDENNNPITEVSTSSGVATFPNLPLGHYTLHEKSWPDEYAPSGDVGVDITGTEQKEIDVTNIQNKSRLVLEKYVVTTQAIPAHGSQTTVGSLAPAGYTGEFNLQSTMVANPSDSDWADVQGYTNMKLGDEALGNAQGKIILDLPALDDTTHQPIYYRFVETSIPDGYYYYDESSSTPTVPNSDQAVLASKDGEDVWHALPRTQAPVVKMYNRDMLDIRVYKNFYKVTTDYNNNTQGRTNNTDQDASTTITLWQTTDGTFSTVPTRVKASGEADAGQTVANSSGHADWTNLRMYDTDGKRIYYLVKEAEVFSYAFQNGQYESSNYTFTTKTIGNVRYIVVPMTSSDGQETLRLYNRQQAIPTRFWKRDKDSNNLLQNMVKITIWKLNDDGTLGDIAHDAISNAELQNVSIQTGSNYSLYYLEPGQKYVYLETNINDSAYSWDSYAISYTNGIKPSTVQTQLKIGDQYYGLIDLSKATQTASNATTSKYATATVYNRKMPLIQITKVDSENTDTVLGGVTYKVYTLVDGAYVPYPSAADQYTITTTSPATLSSVQLPAGQDFYFAEDSSTVPEGYFDPNIYANYENYYKKLNPNPDNPDTYFWDETLGMTLVKGHVDNNTVGGQNICVFTFKNVKNAGSMKVLKYLDGVLKNGFTIKLTATVNGVEKTWEGPTQGTGNNKDLGEALFTDLPVYNADGTLITYTVSETLSDSEKLLYSKDSEDQQATLTVDKTIPPATGPEPTTVDTDGDPLAVYNSTRVSYTAKKVFVKPFEYGYTQYKAPYGGATIGLFVEDENHDWVLADLGEGVQNPKQSSDDGSISFSGLVRGKNYKLIELASGDGSVFPYPGGNYGNCPAGGASTTKVTAAELADPNNHYNVIDIPASEIADTEHSTFPANGQPKEMVNANHWVQFHVKKWLDPGSEHRPAPAPDPIPSDFTPVDNVIFDLYRYVMPGDTGTVTYPGEGWQLINSYTTGTMYNGDERLPGEFLSDADQNVSDHYVYLLVERDIGPNSINKNPYFTYSFWQEEHMSYELDLQVTETFQPEGSPSAVVNNLTYQLDHVNDTDILDTSPPGPGPGTLYLLASIRIAKWKDSFNETSGLPNENYQPLPGARFKISFPDGTVLEELTVGLDAALHPAGQATAQGATYLLEIGGTAQNPTYTLVDYEGEANQQTGTPARKPIPVDPQYVQAPFTFTSGGKTFSGYAIHLLVEETYSPDGFSPEVSGPMDMWLVFADITVSHSGESWVFNDAYYVLTGGTGRTETLAANKVATPWFVTNVNSGDNIHNVSVGDSVNPSPLRIVNYPMDNTLVRVVKYGYQPSTNTMGKNAAALDGMDPDSIDREPLEGVQMVIQKNVSGWKNWNYASNSVADDISLATFTTQDDGTFLFPEGLSEGEYQIYETSIGSGNGAYEMTYPKARPRQFTVTKAALNISMYNPKKFDLSFEKQDLNGNPITASGFTLKLGSSTINPASVSGGKTVYTNLGTGTYKLTENFSGYTSAYISAYMQAKYAAYANLFTTNGMTLGYEYESDGNGDWKIKQALPNNGLIAKDEQGGSFVVTIQNPKLSSAELSKTDENGSLISGATPKGTFVVRYKAFTGLTEKAFSNDTQNPDVIDIQVPEAGETSGSTNWAGWASYGSGSYELTNGKISLTNLAPGVYAFYESVAPGGYDFVRDTSGKKIIYTIVVTGGLNVQVNIKDPNGNAYTTAQVYDYSSMKPDGSFDTKTVTISWQNNEGTQAKFSVENRGKTTLRAKKTVDYGELTRTSSDKWTVKLFLYESNAEDADPVAGVTISQNTNQNPDQSGNPPTGPEGITFKTLGSDGNPTSTVAQLVVGKQYYIRETVTVPEPATGLPLISYRIGSNDPVAVTDPAIAVPVTIGENQTITVEFTNAYLYGEVYILKIDKEDEAGHVNLPGAKFEKVFYKSGDGEDDWTEIDGTVESTEMTGYYKVRFPLVSANDTQYRILETKAPNGYLLAPNTYVGPITLSRTNNVEGSAELPLTLKNTKGDALSIVKLSRNGGTDTSENTLFAVYHKVDGTWVQDQSGYVNASGVYTYPGLMVPGDQYAIAEVSFNHNVYTKLEGVYQVDGQTESELLPEQTQVTYTYEDGTTKQVTLYVLDVSIAKDLQIRVYNVPKVNPVIRKLDVGEYMGLDEGTEGYSGHDIPARTKFAVYDLTGSAIENTAPDDLTAAMVQAFLGADPAPAPVYTGQTGAYNPTELENGTKTEWNGSSTDGSEWNNEKAYLVVETEVSAASKGSVNGIYDTQRRDDPSVKWFAKFDKVAAADVDKNNPPTVTLENKYGDAIVELEKEAAPEEVESLLSGDRDVVFTITPEVTSHNQMLDSFIVKESGITAQASVKVEGQTDPQTITVPVEYKFTSIKVGAASHTVKEDLGPGGFPISATVSFYDAAGSKIDGADVDIGSVASDYLVEQIPDTARSFEISYYSADLRTATAAVCHDVYSLGENFSVAPTTVNVKVLQQDGGSLGHPVDVINKLVNRADTLLTYWKWDAAGTNTTKVSPEATDTAEVLVKPVELPKVAIEKTTPYQSTLLDTTITYRIKIENLSDSPVNFVNPVAMDILPTGVTYVNNSAPTQISIHDHSLNVSTQVFIGEPTYTTGADGTPLSENASAIVFRLTGYLEPGESIEIPFIAKVSKSSELFADTPDTDNDLTVKSLVNDAYLSSTEKSYFTKDNEYGRSFTDVNGEFGVGLSTAANNIKRHSPSADDRETAMETDDHVGDYSKLTEFGWIPNYIAVSLNTDMTTRLVKAVMGDRDTQGFHDTQIGVVSRTNSRFSTTFVGWAQWRLSIINGDSNKIFGDLIIGDVIPKPGDGEERNSIFNLNFDSILSVQNNKKDLTADKYSVLVYTGETAGAETALLNAMHNHVYDAFVPLASVTDKTTITAFIILFDESVKLASQTDLTVIYKTTVPDIQSDEEFAKIAFSNDTNYFFYNYDKRDQTSRSNKVTVTIMDKPVEIQGDLWIDEDQDGIQGDGNHRDYTNYAIVQKLINATSFVLHDERDAASGYSGFTDSGDMSQWNGGESVKHFRFDGLGAATWKLDVTSEDQLYVSDGAGSKILDPDKLKGDDPYHYKLSASISDNDVLKVIGISPLGTGHYVSDDPDASGFSASANFLDNNFKESNSKSSSGSYGAYPFFIRYSSNIDQSKDFGVTLFRELEITKVAADDGTTPIAGAKFSVYGPYEDSVEYPNKTHVPASGDALKFSGSAGSYELNPEGTVTVLETDANGKIVITGLNWWKEYDVKEVEAAPGYDIDGVSFSAGEGTNTTIKTYSDSPDVFTLLVPDTQEVEGSDKVTVTNPRSVEVTLDVYKILESFSKGIYKFKFDLKLTKVPTGTETLNKKTMDKNPIETIEIEVEGDSDTQNPGTGHKLGSFAPVKLFGAGTFEFSITEQTDATIYPGMHYDETSTKTATVTVAWSDTQKKLVVTDIDYSDPAVVIIDDEGNTIDAEKFTNSIEPKPASVELPVKKSITGSKPNQEMTFEFTLTGDNNAPMPTAEVGGNKVTITVTPTNYTNVEGKFGAIVFVRPGTYTYHIEESPVTYNHVTRDGSKYTVTVTVVDDPANPGSLIASYVMTKDAASGAAGDAADSTPVAAALFENNYEPTPAKLEIPVKKSVSGSAPEQEMSFEFTLSKVGDAPMPAGTGNKVTITVTPTNYTNVTGQFGEITYTEVGTYTYKIKEDVVNRIPGVKYDPSEYTVTVTVVDDPQGTLNASYVVSKDGTTADSALFTNVYTPVDVPLGVRKIMTGTLPDGVSYTFTFNLTGQTGKPMPATTSVTVTIPPVTNTASFGSIHFTEEGTYTYTIQEEAGSAVGVTYDTTPKTVTIVVEDDDGELKATVTGAVLDPTSNTYLVEITNQIKTGSLMIKKTVTGNRGNKRLSFPFKIDLNVAGRYPYTVYSAGAVISSGTVESGGTIWLKHGQYAIITGLPAGCIYQVTETNPFRHRVTYTGEVGVIAPDVTSLAAFINYRGDVPPTGENSLLPVSVPAMLLSALGMILTFFSGRKRKERKSK